MSTVTLEKKPTVLIADDDSSTRMLLRATITQWNYPVVEANDGNEAWELICSATKPQIVTVDWMMPKIDGITLCKRAKELAHPPYMILLTSVSGVANIVNALEAGADDFLTKPFNYAELRSRLFVGHRIINGTKKLESIIHEHKTNHHKITKKLASVFSKMNETCDQVHRESIRLQQYLDSINGRIHRETQLELQQLVQNIDTNQNQLAEHIKLFGTIVDSHSPNDSNKGVRGKKTLKK